MNHYLLKELKILKTHLEQREENLDKKIFHRPGSRLIEIHEKFAQLLETHKGEQRFTKEFQDKVSALADEEARLKDTILPSLDTNKLIDEKVTISMAIRDLNNLIFYTGEKKS